MASGKMEDLLKDLDQSMASFQMARSKSQSHQRSRAPPSRGRPSFEAVVAAAPPAVFQQQQPQQVFQQQQQQYHQQQQQQQLLQQQLMQQQHQQQQQQMYQPPMPQQFMYQQPMYQQQQLPPQYGKSSPNADDEIARLRDELARAKIELERQKSFSSTSLTSSSRQNLTASNVFSAVSSSTGKSYEASIHSNDSMGGTSSMTKSAKSRAVSTKTAAKSAYGWTGKCSVRQPGKICDAILDDACNLDHDPVPYSICNTIANQIKEYYYEKTNKGKGANEAILSIMYMINLEDPELVHRGMEVLDIMYNLCGPIFWQNVNLNLDFFVFFLETRKHLTEAEKDNVKYLAGIFASWYLIDANKKDLEDAGHMADPTVRVKQFFEGLLRAGYEFPPGALDAIPRDKLTAITSSWKRGPFSFSKYKQ
ncbi:hypothetical protein BDR26DRAFT_1011319 [Obelidium mucronatum]|nr:hypothetical protein BDR26DRAFT_1011319 [Obelidium mucronatum]